MIYASRTHSQLAQAVDQLRNLGAVGIKSVVLGSRDQLCVHPKVQEKTAAAEKIKLCNALVKAKRCEFYNNYNRTEAMAQDTAAATADADGIGHICDIEDLVTKLKAKRVCPYFKSRSRAGEADIVFVPYNYLLDGSIRATLSGVTLQGSVVILDEAHNVMKTCEESASVSMETQDLALAIKETDVAAQFLEKSEQDAETRGEVATDLQIQDVLLVKEMLAKLEAAIAKGFPGSASTDKSHCGSAIVPLVEESGVTFDRHQWLTSLMQQIVDLLALLNAMGGKETGKGISAVADVIRAVFAEVNDAEGARQKMAKYFRLFISSSPKNQANVIYNLWCFHPGFAMKALLKCGLRSLILTSGTLKPLASFTTELDIQFHTQFTGKHVIQQNQVNYCLFVHVTYARYSSVFFEVLVRTITKSAENVALLSTFNNRSNPAYLRGLGDSIVDIATCVPDGMLVFFPSYGVMEACTEFWTNSGALQKVMCSARS